MKKEHPNENMHKTLTNSKKPSMLAIEFHENVQEYVKNTSQNESPPKQSTGDEIDEKVQELNNFLSGFETDTKNHDDDESKSANIITNMCKICDKIFKGRNSKANLNRHVRQIHEKIRFSCDFCNASYAESDKIRLHIKNEHPNEKLPAQFTVTKPRILDVCKYCNEEFDTENLNTHEERCDSKNDNTNIDIGNISENAQSVESKNLNSMSKCQHCKDLCPSKHLKIHEKTCNKYRNFIAKIDNSNYQCQLCSKICSSRGESYKHVSKEHNTIINKKDDNFDTVSKKNNSTTF